MQIKNNLLKINDYFAYIISMIITLIIITKESKYAY